MNAFLIILGILLLSYPAWIVLQLIGYALYEIFAHNWHEKLFWPFMVGLTIGGGWILLMGLAVL